MFNILEKEAKMIKIKTENYLLFILKTLIYGKFFFITKYYLKIYEKDINRRFKNAKLFRDIIIAKIFSIIIDKINPVYFLDIGANLGEFGKIISTEIPSSNIIFIEPNPNLIGDLKQNVVNTNSTILEYAVSDLNSNQILSFELSHSGGGKISKNTDNNINTESVIVQTVTLDFLAGITPYFARIKYVKIDVEGHELNVFNGGLDFFTNNRPFIVFELSTNDFDGIKKILNDYSFYQINVPGLDYNANLIKRFCYLCKFLFNGTIYIDEYNSKSNYCSGIFAVPNENLISTIKILIDESGKKINFF